MSTLLPVLLSLSISVERILTFCKALIPALTRDVTERTLGRPPAAERVRRVAVHALALAASWLVCALSFGRWDPRALVAVGGVTLPLWLVALLGTGGSAFWNNVLGFACALKDGTRVMGAATAHCDRGRDSA